MEDNSLNDVVKILKNNAIFDLQKTNLSKYERAKLIKSVMDEEQISHRTFAKKYAIPHSTVENWLMYLHVEEIKDMEAKGYSQTEIFNTLKHGKYISTLDKKMSSLQYEINKCRKHQITEKTLTLIIELSNQLQKLKIEIEGMKK